MSDEKASPGKRVRQVTTGWETTDVYHALYLPKDWNKVHQWPVIVEYPGNGGYSNPLGDVSDGTIESCAMGFGLTEGTGFIWVSMPFVSGGGQIARKWWGDVEETKRYCMETVLEVCRLFNGDPERVILAGFSRGAIACNYIGLHDDEISALWCGMICHSHYEGEFRHPAPDYVLWPERLKRLKGRPQFISHEITVDPIRNAIESVSSGGHFTFQILPFKNHSTRWTRCHLEIRNHAMKWLSQFANPGIKP